MLKSYGYAAYNSLTPLRSFQFERRTPGARDVLIEILYCGVCHSDLHQARNEWNGSSFPIVPGHEIVGRVTEVGAEVSAFRPGDRVGVGCMVDACRSCPDCLDHQEQFCENAVFTYNSPDPHTGKMTYGGYSNQIVVDQDFVLRVPPALDLAATAPLLCAGITTYSPLRRWRIDAGHRVGIVGLGGLGHMGLKFAKAFSAEAVLFTTSPDKEADARRLGADDVVVSSDPDAMRGYQKRFDFILNTVAASHDLDPYLALLKRDGVMCLVGVPEKPHPAPNIGNLIFQRRVLAGSLIGGIRETQEMLDFCAERGIVSDIELIPMAGINDAYQRMLKSDVKYRFVIDMATLAAVR
ncbi:NAD(P)-dependent alcohol dehydrogenase [Methylomonas sp. SURF-1]|uniref:NAD(P)-dependent alcohol dehydrogenase n=1 Tax=Methylomonas aurea TaxID=2952224 RepID=A0ABT1UM08_9GAMM|nr:NAD(P)-dependent alcohol dehydrogenase [Methylomonas sp. SURF-1]MCQ8182749.1 NAD(P)-dependent alcohol dehydrogenase [Methylomonas sp. SURF-1]